MPAVITHLRNKVCSLPQTIIKFISTEEYLIELLPLPLSPPLSLHHYHLLLLLILLQGDGDAENYQQLLKDAQKSKHVYPYLFSFLHLVFLSPSFQSSILLLVLLSIDNTLCYLFAFASLLFLLAPFVFIHSCIFPYVYLLYRDAVLVCL